MARCNDNRRRRLKRRKWELANAGYKVSVPYLAIKIVVDEKGEYKSLVRREHADGTVRMMKPTVTAQLAEQVVPNPPG